MRYLAALVIVLFAGGLAPSTRFPQCFRHEVSAQEAKPWMQGTTEIGCNRSGEKPEDEAEHVQWKACSCHHTHNPQGNCDDETQGRNWDPQCQTRCSPKRCLCQTNPACGGTD